MIAAILAGLALGGVYALASASIVMTYVSAGILNFSFAAIAYFVARLYYFLHIQHGWSIAAAGVFSILVVGPLLGVFLWAVLFRFLRLASTLIKIVVMIGLSVCIGPVAILAFGNTPIASPPGLAPEPVKVFHLAGVAITMDQIIVYACVLIVVGGGAALLKWTDVGLQIRAVVDSDAMTSLSGMNPNKVAAGVWAATTMVAGLCGILVAPLVGLDLNTFTVLIAAAFAAVVAARLRSIGVAVLAGLLMGVVTLLLQTYLPPTSQLAVDATPSVPFAFIFVVLMYYAIRRSGLKDGTTVGGPLDRAIAPQGGSDVALARAAAVAEGSGGWLRKGGPLVVVAIAFLLPAVLSGLWGSIVALGAVYAIIFLSYSVTAGEGGQVWLCQITFAGIGAFTTAELVTNHGWPLIPAVVVGGLLCAGVGTLLGLLTSHLGDLYVALVTLTFGLLVENLVFTLPALYNYGEGISLVRTGVLSGGRSFSWIMLAVFCLLAIVVATLRRSTFGLGANAVRWSEPAAATTGIGALAMKVALAGIAAFIAGVGGALYALYSQAAVPGDFATITGLVWLAVLVTMGVRSNVAALVAGLSFVFIPELVAVHLPTSWGEVPPALFGLGAVLVARNPDGTLAMNVRQFEALLSHRHRPSRSTADQIIEQTVAAAGSLDIDGQVAAGAPQTAGSR